MIKYLILVTIAMTVGWALRDAQAMSEEEYRALKFGVYSHQGYAERYNPYTGRVELVPYQYSTDPSAPRAYQRPNAGNRPRRGAISPLEIQRAIDEGWTPPPATPMPRSRSYLPTAPRMPRMPRLRH